MSTFPRYILALTLLFGCLGLSANSIAEVKKNISDSLHVAFLQSSVDSEKVKVLLQLSSVTACTDSSRKLSFANEAYKIARKNKWDRGLLLCNIVLSDYYSVCVKNYVKAIECDQNSIYLAQTLSDIENEAKALEHVAKDYENLGQHNLSLDYLKQVLALQVDQRLKVGVLGDMGSIYASVGDYRQALISYNNALKQLDELMAAQKEVNRKDNITKGGLLLNVGDIYLSMSQFDRALENYNNVYKLGTVVRDQYLQFFSVMAMGKAYFAKKNYAKGIRNLELALFDSRGLKQVMYEAIILDQLANAYLAIGAADKADQTAKASLKIAMDNSFDRQFPKTYTTLSKLLYQQKNYSGAVTYLEKALEYCQKTNEIEDEKNAWEVLSNTYEKMEQPTKALAAYRHFIDLRDSLYNIEKANELVRIDLQAGFNQKQMTDSLKQVKQAKAYEGEVQKQQIITYAVLLGMALVVLLSFFIYRNYNTQKKYNDLLSKEKANHLAYIEAQSNTLTDIAHIQSHNIRGPVSTLLGLVKVFNFEDPTDPDNKEVIEGIAIVTERLDKIVRDVVTKENIIHSKESSIQGKK